MEVAVFTAQETAEDLFVCACNCAEGLYVFICTRFCMYSYILCLLVHLCPQACSHG